MAQEVRDHLGREGWPAPILLSSGNGFCLLYRVDLDVEDGGLIRRFLQALRARFSTALVDIDEEVANPVRGIRLPGTWNRKGDGAADRPHRQVRVVDLPEVVEVVPTRLLEALAHEADDATTGVVDPVAGGDAAVLAASRHLDSLPDSVAGEHGHDWLFAAALRPDHRLRPRRGHGQAHPRLLELAEGQASLG